jgi:[acyl-carrier-protein] S-malonyltransferase
MKAFLFPGQASQYVGMGQDLYNEFDIARDYFEQADDILRLDLKNTCFNGPDDKLVRTEYTQPGIFVHSVIMDAVLKGAGVVPEIAAGHSLGEYSALVSAGVFSYEDGLKAVKLRSQLMQKCCDLYPGTMAAIVGMTFEQVGDVIKGIPEVTPANYNSPDQVAITGTIPGVEAACEKLKAAGAKRAIMLAVGGAYHSPLMADAQVEMAEYIKAIKFNDFTFPVVANVTGKPIDDPATMKQLLIDQITSPVLWYPGMEAIYSVGISEFWEVGPGKVLQGLLKRSLKGKDYTAFGMDKVEDLRTAIGEKV